MVVYSNYGNIIVSYSLEADVTFTITHKKITQVRARGRGILKLGFEVEFVHKRTVKSEFMCVYTKVMLLVCVYWKS